MDANSTVLSDGAAPDGTVLLAGIVGSTAYGLAGPESDVDLLGMFAAPTERFHGLHPPVGSQASRVSTSPDVTVHECLKWCRLALSGNPTATELVWLPDELYQTRTQLGDDLIGIRQAFLSAPRVRDAYLGYAVRQFRRLQSRGDGTFSADVRKRTSKHARHLARLVHQGRQLYTTGRVQIRLADPAWFLRFGQQVADGDLDLARHLLDEAQAAFDRAHSPLPDRPDEPAVERWQLLTSEDPPQLRFMLDEAVVRRVYGGRDAMRCAGRSTG